MEKSEKIMWLCALALAAGIGLGSADRAEAKYVPGKAAFSVRCNDFIFGYEVQGVFVLPGEFVHLDILDANWKMEYVVQSESGTVVARQDRQWTWQIPDATGVYTARIFQKDSNHGILLNAFVMVPYGSVQNGFLNGYPIGTYPEPREIQGAFYTPPKGFIEVTEANREMPVSPHFTIGDFVCRQPSGYPKYLVLDERLVIKLEALLERINAQKYACRTLGISCGYRTPDYNMKQGYVPYSAHVWGQAVDFYVDVDGTGSMSDLNHDSRRNERDAKIIYDIIGSMDGSARHQDLVGGAGLYESIAGHGAFVHVDVRGTTARWEKGGLKKRKK